MRKTKGNLSATRKLTHTNNIFLGDRNEKSAARAKGSGNRTRIFGVGILEEHGCGLRLDGDAALLLDLEKIEHLSGI